MAEMFAAVEGASRVAGLEDASALRDSAEIVDSAFGPSLLGALRGFSAPVAFGLPSCRVSLGAEGGAAITGWWPAGGFPSGRTMGAVIFSCFVFCWGAFT